jgi:hypothetical protein
MATALAPAYADLIHVKYLLFQSSVIAQGPKLHSRQAVKNCGYSVMISTSNKSIAYSFLPTAKTG